MTVIEELVREFYSALNEGELDSVMNYVADDVKVISVNNRVYDKHRFRGMLSQGKDAFPGRRVTIERIMTKDDAAMVEFTWTGTHMGEYLGFPPTNNRIELPMVEILEFESGKVKVLKDFFNWSLFERGLKPAETED